MYFELFLLKNGHNSLETYCIKKKLVLKTTYKKLVLKYHGNARFPSFCLASENAFLSYFYEKKYHNSAENVRIGKKISICSEDYL